MKSRLITRWDWVIFNQCSKWNYGTFEWFSESPFIKSLPVRYEVLNVSQIAMAFHGIGPPSLIQSWLWQYRGGTFFYSSYCSFSNAVRLRSVRCRRPMIPWWVFTEFSKFPKNVRVDDSNWICLFWTCETPQMECGLLGNFLLTWSRRICLSSTCPETPVESCFFDPFLFEVIRVFQPCACTWCCNTKTSASSVLLTVFSVLCLDFFVTTVHTLVDTSSWHVRTPHGSSPIWKDHTLSLSTHTILHSTHTISLNTHKHNLSFYTHILSLHTHNLSLDTHNLSLCTHTISFFAHTQQPETDRVRSNESGAKGPGQGIPGRWSRTPHPTPHPTHPPPPHTPHPTHPHHTRLGPKSGPKSVWAKVIHPPIFLSLLLLHTQSLFPHTHNLFLHTHNLSLSIHTQSLLFTHTQFLSTHAHNSLSHTVSLFTHTQSLFLCTYTVSLHTQSLFPQTHTIFFPHTISLYTQSLSTHTISRRQITCSEK